MIFSIAFKDGRAYFRNKFVKTKGFKEEQVRQWGGGREEGTQGIGEEARGRVGLI